MLHQRLSYRQNIIENIRLTYALQVLFLSDNCTQFSLSFCGPPSLCLYLDPLVVRTNAIWSIIETQEIGGGAATPELDELGPRSVPLGT